MLKLLLMVFLFITSHVSISAIVLVNSEDDNTDSLCSLRSTIKLVNSGFSPPSKCYFINYFSHNNTILFFDNIRIIRIKNNPIEVKSNISILGRNKLIINGGGDNSIFLVSNGSIFKINGIILMNGNKKFSYAIYDINDKVEPSHKNLKADAEGGAINVIADNHSLYVENSIFYNNKSAGRGGGINSGKNNSLVTSINNIFIGNISFSEGGAIYSERIISNNDIYLYNYAIWGGGAISALKTKINNSLFSKNYSGEELECDINNRGKYIELTKIKK